MIPPAMTAQVITPHLVGAKLKSGGLRMILTCMLTGCEYFPPENKTATFIMSFQPAVK